MCLEFSSCFGGRRRDDYGGRARSRGGGYWSAPVPAPVYQQEQPPAVAHEAYHEGAPKADHTDAAGSHAAYLQDKAGSETPPRHPAWHNKVADDAYTPRPHEAAAPDHSHRDNALMDYYHHHHPRQVLATSR
ncbi:unnamed protein product [Triticum turgidum subsp. durum]|uniref:Uncharacterized protein n=1 Tax=Triticum turgidum subsp. durum TaxID=4567 RepID=A0A9R1Q6V5_TRITD|nr:unnamed protein product [Triticum turgidum subsp. durum]